MDREKEETKPRRHERMKLKGLIFIAIGFFGLRNNYAALAACAITALWGLIVLFGSD